MIKTAHQSISLLTFTLHCVLINYSSVKALGGTIYKEKELVVGAFPCLWTLNIILSNIVKHCLHVWLRPISSGWCDLVLGYWHYVYARQGYRRPACVMSSARTLMYGLIHPPSCPATSFLNIDWYLLYVGWIWWKVQYSKNDFFGAFFIRNKKVLKF